MRLQPVTTMANKPLVSSEVRTTGHGVPQNVLDLFYGLTSTSDDERISHTVELLFNLEKARHQQQPKDEEGSDFASLLDYVLKRLVTGLSSNREAAPLGYATALCQLINNYGQFFSVSKYLQIVNNNLHTNKQDNKGQRTHVSLGKILAYTSLIRSSLITQATSTQIRNVLKSVVKIRKRFPMLAATTTECINQLFSATLAMEKDEIKSLIEEELAEELTCGWSKATVDTLQLLLALHSKGLIDEEFLVENWEHKTLISSKTLPYLSRLMIESTSNHPYIHETNSLIVELASAHSHKLFTKLWRDVIIGQVYNAEKQARCYMVYQLIPNSLRDHCKPQTIATILCPDLIGPLMKQMTHRDSYLHKAAVKLMSDLVAVVKDSDSSTQLAILRCLLTEPGSFMFDSITSSRSISNIVSHLTRDAAAELSQELMNVISTDAQLCGRRGEGIIAWCSNTLAHMLTLASVTTDGEGGSWQSDILKFLMLHSSFVVKSPSDQIDYCQQTTDLDDLDRVAVKESLMKGLSMLSTFQTASRGSTEKVSTIDYRDILHNLFTYTSALVAASSSIAPYKDISEEELSVWASLTTTSMKLKKCQKESREDNSKLSMFNAFQLILELFGLHIFIVDQSERSEVIETIQEIQTCFDKATSNKKSKKTGPDWCDVITEILISLMSKSSHLLRSVSSNVFTKILPMCNISAIQLILDVFQTADDEFDGTESMGDESTALDETVEEDEGENSSTSSEESDYSSEEDEGEVDENVRATVQAALGSAAAADSSEQEDSDLSDSEMFKRDDALAEAFRSMRSRNKNAPEELQRRKQVKHFKLRCLDLLEVVVKHSARGEQLLELVVPLLTLIEAGYKETEIMDISKKSRSIHNHLTSLKKLPVCKVKEKEAVADKIDDVLTLSSNAYVWPIMKEITSSLILIGKILSQGQCTTTRKSTRKRKGESADTTEETLTDLLVSKVHSALIEFLTKRESRYNHTLFQGLFQRQPMLYWPCASDLLNAISDSEIRVFYRTQACSLLTQLLHRNVVEQNSEQWKEFTESLKTSSVQVATHSTDNYKPGFLSEYLSMLLRAKSVDTSLVVDVSKFEPIKSKFNKDLLKLYKKVSGNTGTPTKAARKRKSSSSQQEHVSTVDTAVSKKRK